MLAREKWSELEDLEVDIEMAPCALIIERRFEVVGKRCDFTRWDALLR